MTDTCECHNTRPCPAQAPTQAQREAAAYRAYLVAPPDDRTRLWAAYCQIHAQRSPAVVEALERAKGLR